jgi:hypothetical protein
LIARLYYFWGGNQMAGRDGIRGNNQSRNAKVRRRRVLMMGGAVGACMAAAAMATGSAVTAAPAKADFEDLLDPIIQPIVTSLSDAIAGFDPAAATDLTSWTDSLLGSLNSLDVGAALPSTAEPAAGAITSGGVTVPSGDVALPLGVEPDGTEPFTDVSVDGGPSVPVLVDTGSSGLVIPYTDLGSNFLQQLESVLELGIPTGISESSYSGGVDYFYLTYDTSVDYDGVLTTSGTPVDVEFYSYDPNDLSSLFTNDAFQNFDSSNEVDGVLGIGGSTAGPGTSPLESAGYDGVLVDIPQSELILTPTDANPGTAFATVSGDPTTADLTESINSGPQVAVTDDLDSGGVYGTIPSSLLGSSGTVPDNSTITVYDDGTPVYTQNTGPDDALAPTVTSGTSIDSGVEPYLENPIYLNYSEDTTSFDDLLS